MLLRCKVLHTMSIYRTSRCHCNACRNSARRRTRHDDWSASYTDLRMVTYALYLLSELGDARRCTQINAACSVSLSEVPLCSTQRTLFLSLLLRFQPFQYAVHVVRVVTLSEHWRTVVTCYRQQCAVLAMLHCVQCCTVLHTAKFAVTAALIE